jgi:hypothetical protein
MIGNFLKSFSIKKAEQELEGYTQKLSMESEEQHGIILAHAYLILAQLVKMLPMAKMVISSQDGIYGKELTSLIVQTNNLLKQYTKGKDIGNAAGVLLWYQTFRCLSHPELSHYGTKIWDYFSKAQKDAEEYLDNLEEFFDKQDNHSMVAKIREAQEYLSVVPEKFKNIT